MKIRNFKKFATRYVGFLKDHYFIFCGFYLTDARDGFNGKYASILYQSKTSFLQKAKIILLFLRLLEGQAFEDEGPHVQWLRTHKQKRLRYWLSGKGNFELSRIRNI